MCLSNIHSEINQYWKEKLPSNDLLAIIKNNEIDPRIRSKVVRVYINLYFHDNNYLNVLFSHCHIIGDDNLSFYEEEKEIHSNIPSNIELFELHQICNTSLDSFLENDKVELHTLLLENLKL